MSRTTKIGDIVELQEKPKGKGKYYLTNQDLLPAVIEAKEKGKITDRLARMLMLLTDRYSRKSNFVGYTFREDMVAFALVNLSQYALVFNPEKSRNPFSFYTTAIHNSFLQYMANEKKQRYIRDRLLVDNGADPSFNYTGYLNEKDRLKAQEKSKAEKDKKDAENQTQETSTENLLKYE